MTPFPEWHETVTILMWGPSTPLQYHAYRIRLWLDQRGKVIYYFVQFCQDGKLTFSRADLSGALDK